ncbi:MAG: amidohydrolase [Bacteroidales bacterium]
MTKELKVSIVQADLAWENIEENRSNFSKILKEIDCKPHIVVLPEMFTTGFSMNAKELAEPVNGATTLWMQKFAKEKGFAICGSIIIEDKGNFYNRFLFVTPEGKTFKYDKRHLFTFANENKKYTCGQSRLVIEYLSWRILPQICYDVRFPVWSRNRGDYDLMINVANFPAERRDIWTTLLRARAMENQCYVAASNRVGTSGMDIYYTGDSVLLNALGETISEALPGQEKVITGTLNKESLDLFRKEFPVLLDADNFSLDS